MKNEEFFVPFLVFFLKQQDKLLEKQASKLMSEMYVVLFINANNLHGGELRRTRSKAQNGSFKLCEGARSMEETTAKDTFVYSNEKRFRLDDPDGFNCYLHDVRKEPVVKNSSTNGWRQYYVMGCNWYNGRTDVQLIDYRTNGVMYKYLIELLKLEMTQLALERFLAMCLEIYLFSPSLQGLSIEIL